MLVYRFEKLCGVGQMVEHIGRDDQVEEASQVHRLRVRDDGVIPDSLHLATWSGTMSMPTHDRATDASRAWEVRSRPTSNPHYATEREDLFAACQLPDSVKLGGGGRPGGSLLAGPLFSPRENGTGGS